MKKLTVVLCSLVLLVASGWAQPTITKQPSSVAIASGGTATFNVSVSGTGSPQFQWRLNGNNLNGQTTSTLSIQKVTSSECGSYDVVVYNSGSLVVSTTVTLTLTDLQLLPFADNLAKAGSLGFTDYGVGVGSNSLATLEPGEPSPDGVPGGASVWVTWASPYDGVAYFMSTGSGFDTVIAAYTGTTISNLQPVAADDDGGGFLCSSISFPVVSNQVYAIQIDGAFGAKGNIVLSWNGYALTSGKQPLIFQQPKARTTTSFGANVTLSVAARTSGNPNYQWSFNGATIIRAVSSSYTISNVSLAQLGVYTVQITDTNSGLTVDSQPAIVQVNGITGNGQTDPQAFAEDKFRFEANTNGNFSPFTPGDDDSGNAAPASGFSGRQTFNTFGATKDPSEPNPCGEVGGASYWFTYQAPVDGTLTVDTIGSSFPNVLGVYTGPGDSYATLVPVTCADTNQKPGGEVVTVAAKSGTNYYIVVDGIGGVTGTVNLDYKLDPALAITNQPVSQTFPSGVNATLTVGAVGASTLHYQWRFNGTNVAGATASSITRTNFQAAYQGSYQVVVTNNSGSLTSSVATIYLNSPLRFTNSILTGGVYRSTLLGAANTNYIIQYSRDLTNWSPLLTNSTTNGILNFTGVPFSNRTNRFYRALKP